MTTWVVSGEMNAVVVNVLADLLLTGDIDALYKVDPAEAPFLRVDIRQPLSKKA